VADRNLKGSGQHYKTMGNVQTSFHAVLGQESVHGRRPKDPTEKEITSRLPVGPSH
jgi:hypothetical protein